MSIWILVITLWLTNGQVVYNAWSFDDEDQCETAKAERWLAAQTQFETTGSDAQCHEFDSAKSRHS